MKIIVPVKEQATFIECDIYQKELFGEPKFLYHETFPKKPIDVATFKKLLRYDNTLRYLEDKLEMLISTNGDEKLTDIVRDTINKLTRDEVI